VVGHSAERAEMGVRNRTYDLPASASKVELRVQVANFEFRSGGLRRIWYLGPEESIQQGIGRAILREGMVFAVGVVVGLAYLVLFALGPSERARGYFGLACLVIGLRAIPASLSGFGELVAPWAGFELLTRMEYLGTALTIFAGAGYVRTKVPGVAPPRTLKGIQLVALALAAIVAFTPFSLVLETLPLQYAMPVLVMALVIVCYGRAWLRSVPGVTITAAASLLYLLVIVHDILRTMESGIGARVELYPYAMVLWILAEAYELMRRFYQTFIKVETLSGELSEANFELQETESAIVRFVPFDFLRLLGKQSIREVDAGDRVRARISVLHCGFHSSPDASERTGAESRFELVSDLVGLVEPIIQHRGGFVNEFRGDGFQAFFPSGPPDATAAGVEIEATLRRANEDRISTGRSSIEVGIGIDTGPVLLGTVGRRDHLLRGVVGGAVEGAHRIEVLTMRCAGNVLISAATREGLREARDFQVRRVPDGDLPIAEGPIEVYSVCAAEKSGEG
jgi:class 3 adenylate cyclase